MTNAAGSSVGKEQQMLRYNWAVLQLRQDTNGQQGAAVEAGRRQVRVTGDRPTGVQSRELYSTVHTN